jgi:hypothetical protein
MVDGGDRARWPRKFSCGLGSATRVRRHRIAENSLLTKHVVAAGLFARDAGSTPAASTRTKFDGRLAAPWTCLVVVLIAIPVWRGLRPAQSVFGVAGSIFICFTYFVVQQVSLALGTGGHLPAWLAAWLPNWLLAPPDVADRARAMNPISNRERRTFQIDVALRAAELLYQVSNVIHSTLEPQEALQLIVSEAVRLMRASSGSVVLINPTSSFLEIHASQNLPASGARLKLRVGEGITGWVARTANPRASAT